MRLTIRQAKQNLGRMTATEMFKKACEAWGVEISEIVADPKDHLPRRVLTYGGEELNVRWNPEVIEDLKAIHNVDGEKEIVRAILDQLINQLLLRCESTAA